MKYSYLCIALLACTLGNAQSLVQSVNSGSLIAANTAVSVGEIVVNPVNPAQPSSGLIGILTYTGILEVTSFEIANNVVAYPNPTTAGISFQGKQSLAGEAISIYNAAGQLVKQQKIDNSNSTDLSELASGIYLIQFSSAKNKSFKIIKH